MNGRHKRKQMYAFTNVSAYVWTESKFSIEMGILSTGHGDMSISIDYAKYRAKTADCSAMVLLILYKLIKIKFLS